MDEPHEQGDIVLETQKPWYLSRTIWASLIIVLTTFGGMFGFGVEADEGDLLTDAVLQAVTAVAAVIAIVGRIAAKRRIG